MTLVNPRFQPRFFRTKPEDSLPHIVNHQRAYIVPTGRGWAFLLTLLLMLVASVNYALSLGYALCFLLTGLFAATCLHTYRNLAGVQIVRIEGGECFAGDSLPFNITLRNNRSQTRHGLRLATVDARVDSTRLEAEQEHTVSLSLPTYDRGPRALGRLTLQSDWPLGLWTCWSYLHVPAQGLAFPRAEINAPALPMSAGAGTDASKVAGRQGDVSGLRPYQPGDSMGSIAWKAAARGQGLLVRTFDSEEGTGQTLLNLQDTGLHSLELQLSRLCAWVLLAEDGQIAYALHLPTLQLEASHGAEQRLLALRALAMHDFASTQPT